jgi:hypothetical protein
VKAQLNLINTLLFTAPYVVEFERVYYLCNICNVLYITSEMAIGDSGRIVLEIEPLLKRRLYSALQLERKSLKDWFIARAEEYVQAQQQPGLFGPRNQIETKPQ